MSQIFICVANNFGYPKIAFMSSLQQDYIYIITSIENRTAFVFVSYDFTSEKIVAEMYKYFTTSDRYIHNYFSVISNISMRMIYVIRYFQKTQQKTKIIKIWVF